VGYVTVLLFALKLWYFIYRCKHVCPICCTVPYTSLSTSIMIYQLLLYSRPTVATTDMMPVRYFVDLSMRYYKNVSNVFCKTKACQYPVSSLVYRISSIPLLMGLRVSTEFQRETSSATHPRRLLAFIWTTA